MARNKSQKHKGYCLQIGGSKKMNPRKVKCRERLYLHTQVASYLSLEENKTFLTISTLRAQKDSILRSPAFSPSRGINTFLISSTPRCRERLYLHTQVASYLSLEENKTIPHHLYYQSTEGLYPQESCILTI